MSLRSLQGQGRLRPHPTTSREIGDLVRLAERDLRDAAVPGLSADRRFAIAYEAALTLCTIPLYCAGYETHGEGHHWTTFQALPLVLGRGSADLAIYLESCRTKRNVGAYDRSGETSDVEAEELLVEAANLKGKVEAWLEARHPELSRG
jgi:hypothetical protein